MLNINLLPKEYQKKRFSLSLEKNSLYVVAVGAAILVLLAAYTLFFQIIPSSSLDKDIEQARLDSQQYADEIQLVNDLNAKKNLILTRMGTIEELDRNRDAWVNVVSDMASRITDYLWLTKLGIVTPEKPPAAQQAQQGQQGQQTQQAPPVVARPKTVIEGNSFSINSLATFLIRLKKSPYLDNVNLVSVILEEEKGGGGTVNYEAYHFVLNCDLLLTGTDAAQTEGNKPANKLAAGSEF